MKKIIFTVIKWIAALYAIAYIIFGFTFDTDVMKAITGILLAIFSIHILLSILNFIEKMLNIKSL